MEIFPCLQRDRGENWYRFIVVDNMETAGLIISTHQNQKYVFNGDDGVYHSQHWGILTTKAQGMHRKYVEHWLRCHVVSD